MAQLALRMALGRRGSVLTWDGDGYGTGLEGAQTETPTARTASDRI